MKAPWFVAVVGGLLVGGLSPGGDLRAASLHSDSFTAPGTAGWSGGLFGSGLPTRQSSGGPAGDGDAYLRGPAPGTNLATYNDSAAWQGSYAAIGASRIRVDMQNAPGSDPLWMRAVLFAPGSVAERWTSAEPQLVPADGTWRSYEFSLAESDLAHVAGTATYAAAMENVVRVMLRHDPGTPSPVGEAVSAVLGLDNIELAGPAGPAFAADFTNDGHVDGEDLAAWAADYGSLGGADADGDGATTGADFLVWQREFGSGLVASASAAVVPELASARLAGVVFVASVLFRRQAILRCDLARLPSCAVAGAR